MESVIRFRTSKSIWNVPIAEVEAECIASGAFLDVKEMEIVYVEVEMETDDFLKEC